MALTYASGIYDVDYEKVAEIEIDYAEHENEIESAIYNVCKCMCKFVQMSSFQGKTADSVKSYLSEVHPCFQAAILCLMEQLETDYANEYHYQFSSSNSYPIFEAFSDARYHLNSMATAINCMNNVSGMLGDSASYIQKAIAALPSTDLQIELGTPSATSLIERVDSLVRDTERTWNAVSDLEVAAASTFSSGEGKFSALATSLSDAMSRCVHEYAPNSYVGGSFSSLVDATGLKGDFSECLYDQTQKMENTKSSQRISNTQMQEKSNREIEDLREEKEKWCLLGVAGSTAESIGVALLVLGAAAAIEVGTAGMATPVLLAVAGTISFYGAFDDTLDRVDQYKEVKAGDAMAGIDNDAAAETATKLASFGSSVMANVPNSDWGAIIEDSVDYFSDTAAGQMGGVTKAQVKTTVNTASFIYDMIETQTKVATEAVKLTKGGYAVGWAGKAATIGADYKIEQCDAKLKELDMYVKRLESQGNLIDSRQQYSELYVW